MIRIITTATTTTAIMMMMMIIIIVIMFTPYSSPLLGASRLRPPIMWFTIVWQTIVFKDTWVTPL